MSDDRADAAQLLARALGTAPAERAGTPSTATPAEPPGPEPPAHPADEPADRAPAGADRRG